MTSKKYEHVSLKDALTAAVAVIAAHAVTAGEVGNAELDSSRAEAAKFLIVFFKKVSGLL